MSIILFYLVSKNGEPSDPENMGFQMGPTQAFMDQAKPITPNFCEVIRSLHRGPMRKTIQWPIRKTSYSKLLCCLWPQGL